MDYVNKSDADLFSGPQYKNLTIIASSSVKVVRIGNLDEFKTRFSSMKDLKPAIFKNGVLFAK
jgi:hypothetical protein